MASGIDDLDGDYQQEGSQQQGSYQQGSYQQGGYQQGSYQQGGYQQGGYQQGGFQQGIYQQGIYQQGGYQQGIYQQGNYQQGNYQQGNYQQQENELHNQAAPYLQQQTAYAHPVVTAPPVTELPPITDQELHLIRSLLPAAEHHKWKYISTKLSKRQMKKLSADFCCSKMHEMFGLPYTDPHTPHRYHLHTDVEGVVGSSIPYLVSQDGWKKAEENENENKNK